MQNDPSKMSDEGLVAQIKQMVADEFLSLAELLTLLAEMDERRLYAKLGYSSLFVYMVQALHLSEDATYKRIQAARAAKRYPIVLSLLSEGKLNLTAINILTPTLTDQNHEDVLKKAAFKSNRDVERMRAEYAPRPDVPDLVRKLSTTTCAAASCLKNNFNGEAVGVIARRETTKQSPADICSMEIASLPTGARNDTQDTPARRDEIKPLSGQRVKFQFTGSEELRGKIERAKQLLRHKHPNGRLEDIIEEALDALLAKKDPEKRIERRTARKPSKSGRPHAIYIPQHVKDAVWQRDQGRCQYIGADGRRCGERGGLEFDHIKPWAKGGISTDPENICLLCRTHNQLAMSTAFGVRKDIQRNSL
jgi:hypothetical protein